VIESAPWPGADASVWEASSLDESGENVLGVHDAIVHAAVRSVEPWQPATIHRVADLVRLTSTLGYRRAADAIADKHVSARAETHGSSTMVTAALEAADQLIGVHASISGDRNA
jgi:hypothetical protein